MRLFRRLEPEGIHLGIDVGDLLDCTSFTRATVASSDDAAISALSEFLDKLIFGVDDESRVERGERMPLHVDLRQRR